MRVSLPQIALGVPFLMATAFLGPSVARAGTLYQTGFEPPAFTAGQPVDGQDVWVAILSPDAGIVTTSVPAGGVQSLQVNGGSLEFYSPDGLFEGLYNPSTLFNVGASPKVWVQADIRLDGPATADDLISANLIVANSTDVLAQSYLSSDGHVYGQTTDDFQQLGTASLGVYHHLGLLLDFVGLQGQYYLDGQLLGTLAIPSSVLSDSDFTVSVGLFAVEDTGGFSRTDYTAYADNVGLASVPEPSAILLLATGIPALAWAVAHGRRGAPGGGVRWS